MMILPVYILLAAYYFLHLELKGIFKTFCKTKNDVF